MSRREAGVWASCGACRVGTYQKEDAEPTKHSYRGGAGNHVRLILLSRCVLMSGSRNEAGGDGNDAAPSISPELMTGWQAQLCLSKQLSELCHICAD